MGKDKISEPEFGFIDKMHMDIYTLGVLILTAIGMSIFWNVSWDTLNKPSSTYTLGNIFIGVTVLSLIFIICLSCLLSFVRRQRKESCGIVFFCHDFKKNWGFH